MTHFDAEIQHLKTLDRTIARLTEARRDALDQMQHAAARQQPLDEEDAHALLHAMDGVPGRQKVLNAAGWWLRDGVLRQRRPGAGVPCVYLLIREDQVVYVGRSTNVTQRFANHHHRGAFDRYQIIRCRSEAHMWDLEAVLIQQHRPPLNQRIEQRPVGVDL